MEYHVEPIRPRIKLADGWSLSVQASAHHYSTPRTNGADHYEAVEIGYIQDAEEQQAAPPEEWREYADGDFPSDVYGYVPRALVEAFVEAHGGTHDEVSP